MSGNKRPFRILSLDGGGIRGVISARLLQEVDRQLREHCGQSVGEYFDMIAGTSTGSLIAAAIAVGYTPEDLVDIYRNQGLEIFPYQKLLDSARWKLVLKYGWSAPKFSNEGIVKVVSGLERFKAGDGYVELKDAGRKTPDQAVPGPILLILAYDAEYRNTTFFTNYHPGTPKKWYDSQPLWKVCVASAAAPTYFPAMELTHTEKAGDIEETWSFPHVDGGVTANNPALCAISRAIELGHRLEDIQLLSIGTGQNKKPLAFREIEGWGLIKWGLRIADVFMEGQAEVQGNICLNLLGGKSSNRYLRLQFDLNEAFGQPRNYLAQAPILPDQQRLNTWLKAHLQEAMDDARKEPVDLLLKATEGYLESGNLFETRFDHYGSVKDGIRQFVLCADEPRPCHKK
jgi:patatin-like phospholipase/acyl hydrolase